MAMNLFEHNKTAYEAAVCMLSEHGKAAVIHPTGTGKSFIGFKLCENNPDKKLFFGSLRHDTSIKHSLKTLPKLQTVISRRM